MADPYDDLLGLPPHMRPPSHYQLLGIASTEMSTQAIKSAAKRQLDRLRRHSDGPLADDCRRIAREIKQACQTLLDPAARQRYDQLAPDAAAPWWMVAPPPDPPEPPIAASDLWDEVDADKAAEESKGKRPSAPLPDWMKEPAPNLENPKSKR